MDFLVMAKNLIERELERKILVQSPQHSSAKGYHYAVLPAGKLFRPLLACASFADLSRSNDLEVFRQRALGLSLALEIHHAYTLVHDDLPSMDNDSMRRGKLATHKAFGEWQAILIGDGLLNLSYQCLSEVKTNDLALLLKLFSWATGPKGLIQGQVYDLSGEMNSNWAALIETHKLKTARLIQLATTAPGLCLEIRPDNKVFKNLWRLGYYVGIVFQLLDDLTELCDERLNEHEKEINPWLTQSQAIHTTLNNSLNRISSIIKQSELLYTKEILSQYFSKIYQKTDSGLSQILEHLSQNGMTENKLRPTMDLLKL